MKRTSARGGAAAVGERLRRGLLATLVLLLGAPGASVGQVHDHLSCHPVRVRGDRWLVDTGVAQQPLTLRPATVPFPIEEGCRLVQPRKLRPREVCVPATAEPQREPLGGPLSEVYACYPIRCRSERGFTIDLATRFGSGARWVRREGGLRTLCVPTRVLIDATPAPTSTPVATNTPTPTAPSTATPGPSVTAPPAPTPTPTIAPPAATPSPTPTAVPATPAPTATASPEPCWSSGQCVFLSSARYTGSAVGGAPGANAKCQALAEAADLPGTYDAWLGTSASSPSTSFPQPATPYRRVDGVLVASSWSDLTDGTLAAPINVTEQGTALTGDDGSYVWTASDRQGVYQYPGCDDFGSQSFIGRVGSYLSTGATWTTGSNPGYTECLRDNRLYCFQVAVAAPTPTPTASPRPTPTPTRTPNPDPPIACIASSPSSGMVYCYPTDDVAFDVYTDLLAAASRAGVSGIDDTTPLHVAAVGGNGGNGKSKTGCKQGIGGDGGFATTLTRVRDVARFKGGTTVQWLAGDSGRHIDDGGTGGASSIVWVADSASTAPSRGNVLVLAGGGGGGGACNVFEVGHDGGHGGFVNGLGTADNGNHDNYLWTTTFSMAVGPGEDGHGAGGHPGSLSGPGAAGADWDGSSGGSRDATDGYGGRGGRTNDSGPPEADGGGWTHWQAGSVDGETLIGTSGRGSDNYFGTQAGAGGGGFGGGGTGKDGQDSGGGGGGGGSLALANTIFDRPPLARSAVSHRVAFVFVK